MKISLIIPVYNAGKYLSDTLACLERQTIKDFEVILVNDFSTDDSYEIYLLYKEKLSVKWINMSHHLGAGEARNYGLRFAGGEYVLFLDADDLFETDLLERMLEVLEENGADVALSDFDSFVSEKGYIGNAVPVFTDSFIRNHQGVCFEWEDIPDYFRHWTNVPWNKMVRREFLEVDGIRFQNLSSSNDVYYSHMLLMKGKLTFVKTERALIHYRIGYKGQISSKRSAFCEIEAYKKVLETISEAPELEKYRQRVLSEFIYGLCKHLKVCKKEEFDAFFTWFHQEILWKRQFFSRDFIEQNHEFLLKKLGEQEQKEWWNTNFSFVENVWKNRQVLAACLKKYENRKNVFIFERNAKADDFLDIAGLSFKKGISDVEEGAEIELLLVLGPLELTNVKRWIQTTGVSVRKIFPVYKAPALEFIEV